MLTHLTLAIGRLFACLSIIALIFTALVNNVLATAINLSSTGFLLMCALQCVSSLFMSYASQLKIQKQDIAETLYPSSLAVQMLLLLMWQYNL